LCGNVKILNDLDRTVARVVEKEDAITFPTGYMANLAIFQAIMDPFMAGVPYSKGSGVIFSDEHNHATIVDGCRLSTAKKEIFKHNDMVDLEKRLKKYPISKHKMIVTEGVFTLDGHFGKLKEIAALAKKYNCIFMVDDAHGVGVVGSSGGGTPQQLGVTKDVDILMGSFDKTIGCMGGYLAGNKKIIEYLRVAARPYMFSSAVPAILGGGVIESLNICASKEGVNLRKKLMENSEYLREKLTKMGYKILGDGTISVLPVIIGDENKSIEFSERLFRAGVYIPCFRWPAVPKGEARARVTVMATHTKVQLDKIADALKMVGKELGVI
jgi:7-keto-8-aminopelargonate synthetase-like enzyme